MDRIQSLFFMRAENNETGSLENDEMRSSVVCDLHEDHINTSDSPSSFNVSQ